MTKQDAARRKRKALAIEVIRLALIDIDANQGKEFYSKPYDKAIKIIGALKDARLVIHNHRREMQEC
jgi:hypothetical protein